MINWPIRQGCKNGINQNPFKVGALSLHMKQQEAVRASQTDVKSWNVNVKTMHTWNKKKDSRELKVRNVHDDIL